MDETQAQAIAAEYIAEQEQKCGIPLTMLKGQTISRDFGWVFFYDVDSSRSSEVIAGNSPFIVDKETEELHACGTAYPIDCYIDEYERGRKPGAIQSRENVWR